MSIGKTSTARWGFHQAYRLPYVITGQIQVVLNQELRQALKKSALRRQIDKELRIHREFFERIGVEKKESK